MYADELTDSMRKAISETNRRRKIQMEYNEVHGIVPQTIKKDIREEIKASIVEETKEEYKIDNIENKNVKEIIDELTTQMLEYAQKMEFEEAAKIRDKIKEWEKML